MSSHRSSDTRSEWLAHPNPTFDWKIAFKIIPFHPQPWNLTDSGPYAGYHLYLFSPVGGCLLGASLKGHRHPLSKRLHTRPLSFMRDALGTSCSQRIYVLRPLLRGFPIQIHSHMYACVTIYRCTQLYIYIYIHDISILYIYTYTYTHTHIYIYIGPPEWIYLPSETSPCAMRAHKFLWQRCFGYSFSLHCAAGRFSCGCQPTRLQARPVLRSD